SFKLLLIVVAMHIIGMQLCKKEPLAIDILLTHFRKTPPVPNKSFHGGLNSYNMFG
ncbi:MAG: VirB3 family type IV secretion system protein, partial [Rickettsiales bacterium]|nr:VirB3 family type IV secretion system protein [Rickettsiales bacterium]MBQ7552540.1 VirB3 family type IV secretion system protein [Rickettsiales bacterium]